MLEPVSENSEERGLVVGGSNGHILLAEPGLDRQTRYAPTYERSCSNITTGTRGICFVISLRWAGTRK